MVVYLKRLSRTPTATYGMLEVCDGPIVIFKCVTLELPWRNNQKNISCIPAGEYPMDFEWSNSFKRDLWELKEVPGRSEVKIHAANYYEQLRGCIALGSAFADLNIDGVTDVTNSKRSVNRFHQSLQHEEGNTVYLVISDPTKLRNKRSTGRR